MHVKKKKSLEAGGVVQAVEHLPSKRKSLSSKPPKKVCFLQKKVWGGSEKYESLFCSSHEQTIAAPLLKFPGKGTPVTAPSTSGGM
jgi:hypothetical protein